ncbi:MAG TPA: class I SAM-dependent methyltransferase [Candidatus Paceibacterota bacterium]|nr:class I SAM-dependent methyltransferase [Verrucomicrobiota bacterium]HRY51031.1 class I SAM-dependent methyltransferase [Candidatus Paceibacterota bacterium]HSA01691.1 class I SAM-dependent methyltransferase [Candidatus Paceibacterota bacterium]
MAYVDFISSVHKRTQRDYLGRVNEFPKAEAAKIARQFGRDYWDGDRKFGYGGMRYDGRWRVVAETMAKHYGLKPGDRILDVGCGKAFLLYDFTQAVPGIEVQGIDISEYAVANAKEEVRPFLKQGHARQLPYPDQSFDLVISLNTLHNLYCYDLDLALREMQRVGRRHRYLVVESYRNEQEKANLLYWQLTCESFYTPSEWEWWFQRCGYAGDWSFIYFE